MSNMQLTGEEAADIVGQAVNLVSIHPGYRLGQAIWNLMPVELTEGIEGSAKDFYYQEDVGLVIEMFYNTFVENEDE